MHFTLSPNCVQVQTLPIAQETPVLTDSFSRGYDPYTHACKARPLSTDGWTSLSVICHLSFCLGAVCGRSSLKRLRNQAASNSKEGDHTSALAHPFADLLGCLRLWFPSQRSHHHAFLTTGLVEKQCPPVRCIRESFEVRTMVFLKVPLSLRRHYRASSDLFALLSHFAQ